MTNLTLLRMSLHDLSLLTDAEQYFIWGWFATGARHYLYRIGVDDAIIGERPLFPDDERSEYDGPSTTSSANLLRWVEQLRFLPYEFSLALRDWFFWHDRGPLYRASVADGDIGVKRLMPDDIWSYEDDYGISADGTLKFVAGAGDGSVNALVFLDGEWQDP